LQRIGKRFYICPIKHKEMSKFNSNIYQPNKNYSVNDAEKRLLSLGYFGFEFKSVSYTNGCSFYFTSNEGKEIRVSDHPLTGKRAFDTIQVLITEVKALKPIVKPVDTELQERIKAAIQNKTK